MPEMVHAPQVQPAGRTSRFFAALLISILGAAAWIALQWGATDMLALWPRAELDRWQNYHDVPDTSTWESARAQMEIALMLEPGNPALLEDMGRLHDFGSARADLSASERTAMFRQSLAYFRRAVGQRPVSPFGWASVALMKYKLNEIDHEFFHALGVAIKLGPWEPGLHLLVSSLGLAVWQRVPEPLADALREHIRRGLQWDAEAIWRIAKERQQTGAICDLIRQHALNLPALACQ